MSCVCTTHLLGVLVYTHLLVSPCNFIFYVCMSICVLVLILTFFCRYHKQHLENSTENKDDKSIYALHLFGAAALLLLFCCCCFVAAVLLLLLGWSSMVCSFFCCCEFNTSKIIKCGCHVHFVVHCVYCDEVQHLCWHCLFFVLVRRFLCLK